MTAPWPPPYNLIKHPRARQVKLKISHEKGLQLVVPKNFKLREIPPILEEHKAWIQKQLARFQTPQPNTPLPNTIHLAALGETWQVRYIPMDANIRMMTHLHREIVLFGKIENTALSKRYLIAWVKKIAKKQLSLQLARISQELKLPYTKLTIRDQKTRWGSCTEDKAISLNYKLIFFPPSLARHIMIHELCHTVHLNHSTDFWQLVASFDQDCQQHRRALKNSHCWMPDWLM